MAYGKYQDNSAPNTTQVWQNSIGYLQLLQEMDVEINKALAEGNIKQGIQFLNQLLVMVERIVKKKEENGRSEHFNSLMPRIDALQEKVLTTDPSATELRKEQYKEMRDIYLNLGDIMYKLDLVFKQGIDAVDWWAEG